MLLLLSPKCVVLLSRCFCHRRRGCRNYHDKKTFLVVLLIVFSTEIITKANAQTTHIQVQNYQNRVSYVSSIHTGHTKHTVLDLHNACNHHAPFNYSRQESKKQLTFYDPDILVTLK